MPGRMLTLNTGAKMPIIGLGCWQAPKDEVRVAVEAAIDAGYRLIDTAWAYKNEDGVGEGINNKIKQGVIKRHELFVITKLHGYFVRREDVMEGIKSSLASLQLDYVDLFLIHTPMALKRPQENQIGTIFPVDKDGKFLSEVVDHLETWKGMEDVFKAKLTKAIGLSNFNSKQIQHIYDNAQIKPSNLQVECNAYFPQVKLFDFCKKLNITMTAYGPMGSPGLAAFAKKIGHVDLPPSPVLMEEPMVQNLAKKYNKSPAQIFDFELEELEMQWLTNSLPHERMFKFEFGNSKEHPDYPFSIPF